MEKDQFSNTVMAPSGTTSVLNMLRHLSDPKLVTRGLPVFQSSFIAGDRDQSNPARSCAERYVRWKEFAFTSSNISSFTNLLASVSSDEHGSIRGLPRVTFFGEQHHEPSVLRSQLQAFSALHTAATNLSQSVTSRKSYRLHLVLEHFSILDQDLLAAFSAGRLNDSELVEAYEKESVEGFQLNHYLPLLKLAKELDVPIWGGFPPRAWAKLVNREGVKLAETKEDERMNNVDTSCIHVPRFTAWDSVVNLSDAHKSYLSSLRNPDKPLRFPPSYTNPHGSIENAVTPETKGFHPAQALKDAYLAHVTAWVLNTPDTETDVNIVMVICGLGHCEYGFGAPERLVKYLQSEATSSELRRLRPFIIASKFNDARIWRVHEVESAASVKHELAAHRSTTEDAVHEWLEQPWQRKLADAVVLHGD